MMCIRSGIGKQMALAVGALLPFSLFACSQGDATMGRSVDSRRVLAEGHSVTIVNAKTDADALPMAQEYCDKRFGQSAYFDRMISVRNKYGTSKGASFVCMSASKATPDRV